MGMTLLAALISFWICSVVLFLNAYVFDSLRGRLKVRGKNH